MKRANISIFSEANEMKDKKITHRKEHKTYPVPQSMTFSKVGKKCAPNMTHGPASKKKK